MEQNYSYMTMRDYIRVLFRHKAVIFTSIIVVTLTTFAGLLLKTPVYKAEVKMLIQAQQQVESPYYREILGYGNMPLALTQSEIVRSNPVLGLTVRALSLYSRPLDYERSFASKLKKLVIIAQVKTMEKDLNKYSEEQKKGALYRMAIEDLKHNVKVEPIRDTNLFVISVTDYSPVGAATIVNTVSRAYAIFDLEQQLSELQLKYGEKHPTSIQLKENIEKMSKNLSGQPLSDIEAIGPASVKIIEQASLPIRPEGLPRPMMLALAFILSIFLGVMLAFVFEYLDQTIRFPKEAEEYLNVPCLGSIPKGAKQSYYHDLADQIYLLMRDKKLKSLVFTSALAGEGVSTLVVNLGTYLAKTVKHKVLVIDANLRNPTIEKLFKIPKETGLVDVLEGKLSFEKAVKEAGNNLDVLAAGSTTLNPVTLLSSHMMQELLKIAKEKYPIILIDSAQISIYKDGVILSAYADGAVMVVNEGKTRKQVVKASLAHLEQNKTNILGVVLNNRTFPIPEKIYNRI
ncbi:MAG: polysaccharide biosynthesis tyrosine autokinase [Candidatus Omnitrophota bacterium]|jgi:capsular exopolysaccharide synthesis family protein